MDLEKLQLFIHLAEIKSLSKAAVLFDTTASALSRQVASLEAELGGRLFHRTGRGITLTELGARLLGRAVQLLADARNLTDESHDVAGKPHGKVRIGLLHGLIPLLLPNLYLHLAKHCPNVRLHCFEGSSGMLREWVSSGYVDIGFVTGDPDRQAQRDFHSFRESLRLIGAFGDPLTSRPTLGFQVLQDIPLVLPGLPNSMRANLEQVALRKKMKLRIVAEAESIPAQLALVAGGHAYAINPMRAITLPWMKDFLSATKLVEPTVERTISLAISTQKPASLAVRKVAIVIRTLLMDADSSRLSAAV